MHILKKIGLWAASGLFRTMLILLALTSAVILTFGKPEHIKNVLKAENVYGTARDALLEQAKNSASKQAETELPISDPNIQQIVKESVPTEFLESSSNEVVDGVYAWLEGKTAKPEFSVETKQVRDRFVVLLGDYAEKKYVALPVCTKAQERGINLSEPFDPFNATCRPAALSASTVRSQLVTQLEKGEFFKESKVDSSTLPKDPSGQTTFDNVSEAPKAYQFSKKTPWIFTGFALIFGAAVVFLHYTRRKGVKSVAISLISVGILLGGLSLLAATALHRAIQPDGVIGKSLQSDAFQRSIANVVDSLSQTFTTRIVFFAAAYALIGVTTLLALRFFWKDTEQKQTGAPDNKNTNNTDKLA